MVHLLSKVPVLARVSIAVMNTTTSASWGGKGLFDLHFHIRNLSLRVVGAGTQTEREPRDRSRCRGHGVLLTGCSVSFLMEPSISS